MLPLVQYVSDCNNGLLMQMQYNQANYFYISIKTFQLSYAFEFAHFDDTYLVNEIFAVNCKLAFEEVLMDTTVVFFRP